MKWYNNAVFYHIYPLGFCGCEIYNDYQKEPQSRILKIIDFIDYFKDLGVSAIYFGPIFESVKHGYDTNDYFSIDRRLGTNEDFKKVCNELHSNNIKIIVDGVFNHVGRDFWAFNDVKNNKFNSQYKDWFLIRDGNSNYNDGFFYEGWEGHYELVKLNLHNYATRKHLIDAVNFWIDEFNIDGIRLDVAYCLNHDFLKELRNFTDNKKDDFWLMGETLHGDYNVWMNDTMLHSVTNYECYKGLYSSLNEENLFEIAHSLNRQFGKEHWTLYKNKQLYCFADNHDVSRIASILKNPNHLPLIYTLLFSMPGIPSIYYGSELGILGDKKDGDEILRPEFHLPKNNGNDLFKHIKKLIEIRINNIPLNLGNYQQIQLNNKYFVFSREYQDQTIIIIINIDNNAINLNLGDKQGIDLLTNQTIKLNNILVNAYQSVIIRIQNK